MLRIFLILLMLLNNVFAISLKEYLLQYCFNNNLTLVYTLDKKIDIYPKKDFNFLDLSNFYDISFIKTSNFLIVRSAILKSFSYHFSIALDESRINSITKFLISNNIQSFAFNNNSVIFVTTSYKYKNIIFPFLKSKDFKISFKVSSLDSDY